MYDGTFAAFYLHFLPDGQDDVLGICLAQRSLELAAVGGDDRELGVLEGEQHARYDAARLVLGDGVGGLAEHFAEDFRWKREADLALGLRKGREVADGKSDDPEEGRAAAKLRRVVVVDLDVNGAVAELADDADEPLDGERRGARLVDLGGNHAADADVKVGGADRKDAVLGLEQRIGQNLQRTARGHYVLDAEQRLEETGLFNCKFHLQNSLFGSFHYTKNRGARQGDPGEA